MTEPHLFPHNFPANLNSQLHKRRINLYQVEFDRILGVARRIADKLDADERSLALQWFKRLSLYNSRNKFVQEYRNKVLLSLVDALREDFYNKILSTDVGMKFTDYEKDELRKEVNMFGMAPDDPLLIKKALASPPTNVVAMWSADRRVYLAVKPMPGEGALVYMAVSKRPELGWDFPTIQDDDFIDGECQ